MHVSSPFFRTGFNYDRDAESDASGLDCFDASRTKQSFKDECDINTIMRKFGVTGQLPQNVRAPMYGDFADVFDYHSALNAIAKARESFDRMPAVVRARFHNEPEEFVDFCLKEENRSEMEKFGLLIPKPAVVEVDAPALVPVPDALSASVVAPAGVPKPA